MQLLKIEKRKGISPLIATLLLIAIAVAASVLTYSWVMSMIGSQSGQAQTQIRIDGVEFVSATSIAVTVRNTGSIDAQIESVWVRANTAGSTWDKVAMDPAQPVLVGKAGDVAATLAVTLADNASYVVRVTTTSGFYYESVATSPVF